MNTTKLRALLEAARNEIDPYAKQPKLDELMFFVPFLIEIFEAVEAVRTSVDSADRQASEFRLWSATSKLNKEIRK